MTSLNTNATPLLSNSILIKRGANLLTTNIKLSNTFVNIKSHKKQKETPQNTFNLNTSLQKTNVVAEFINIYQHHQQDKRWILMIDPEQQDIEYLSRSNTINPAKILRIDSKKVKLSTKNIENTLVKGNCCAIVLCNANFDQQQLSTFNELAKQGNTQCIVVNNKLRLH